MALVNAPPILIDFTGYSRQANNVMNPMGPFKYGSNLYTALRDQVDTSPGVFKSVDDGATWIEMDSAGKPPGSLRGPILVFNDATNNTIVILYTITTFGQATYYSIDFDTSTDTYGSPSNGYLDISFGADVPFGFYKKTDGTIVILFRNNPNYKVLTYSAGSWTGPIIIFTGTIGTPYNGVRDGSNNFFFGINTGSLPATTSFGFVNSSLSYTSGGAITTFPSATTSVVSLFMDVTTLKGVVAGYGPGSIDTLTAFSIATPTGIPVVTLYTVDTQANLIYPWVFTAIGGISGGWVVFFGQTDRATLGIDYIKMSTFNGVSFDPAVLYYDAVSNPPSDEDPDDFVHTLDGVEVTSGNWGIITALEIIIGVDPYCAGFFLIPSAVPPVTIEFDLKGAAAPEAPGSLFTTLFREVPVPPGPVTDPTECPNQD